MSGVCCAMETLQEVINRMICKALLTDRFVLIGHWVLINKIWAVTGKLITKRNLSLDTVYTYSHITISPTARYL